MATAEDKRFRTLTDEERQARLERYRRELPELDRMAEEGAAAMRWFASGEWRRRRRGWLRGGRRR